MKKRCATKIFPLSFRRILYRPSACYYCCSAISSSSNPRRTVRFSLCSIDAFSPRVSFSHPHYPTRDSLARHTHCTPSSTMTACEYTCTRVRERPRHLLGDSESKRRRSAYLLYYSLHYSVHFTTRVITGFLIPHFHYSPHLWYIWRYVNTRKRIRTCNKEPFLVHMYVIFSYAPRVFIALRSSFRVVS